MIDRFNAKTAISLLNLNFTLYRFDSCQMIRRHFTEIFLRAHKLNTHLPLAISVYQSIKNLKTSHWAITHTVCDICPDR